MELFSQRQELEPVKKHIQKGSMDSDLQNCLWNQLFLHYLSEPDPASGVSIEDYEELLSLIAQLWLNYFKHPIDTLNHSWNITFKFIRKYFFSCEWNKVYDFIEFIAHAYPNESVNKKFMNSCNSILEREISAYRFVGGKITEVTSEEEIEEIEKALQISPDPIKEHLSCSLGLLSDRENPDYRNSIKESISAVEAVCKRISKDDTATLGQALKEIEREGAVKLHPALKSAFDKLYGYTSDTDGIRHSLMDTSDLHFEDAKFMLVSCSAFINYLIEKSSKTGIEL